MSGHTDDPVVCVATLMRPTGETGVQTHFNGFLQALERRDVPTACVTPFSAPRALVYPVFGVRRLLDPVSGTASVWWYRHWHARFLRLALRRVLGRAERPVVVYAQCPLSADVALQVRRGSAQRVVMVVHFNGSQAEEWAGKGRIPHGGRLYRSIRQLEERTLPALDAVVYVSEFMRSELETRLPALRDVPSAVVPNFVRVEDASGGGGGGGLVGVGTLEPRKNQAYLLEVLAAASRAGRHFTLTLVGDGPDRPRLERLAQSLGVGGQVRFLGFRPDARALLRGHDLFVHAARHENFPLAILEAMAEGIPPLAAPVGGIPEVFRDGVEGVFWPLDAPDEAAHTLVELMDDRARRARLGAAARRRVEEEFSADVVAGRLYSFLRGAPAGEGVPSAAHTTRTASV